MRLLILFSRSYPRKSAFMLMALLFAGLAEGVGLTTLLPLLSTVAEQAHEGGVAGTSNASGIGVESTIVQILEAVGLAPSAGVLLIIVVLGMVLKSGLVLLANRQVGYTVAHVATDLRLALIRALLSARWEYYLRQPVGTLANSVATEATRAASAYLHGATMLALLIQAIVYLGVAVLVSWPATLASLAAGFIFLYLLNRLIYTARQAGAQQTQLLKSLLARFTDNLYSVKPLKAMGRESLVDTLLRGETHDLNHAMQREVFSKEALRSLQEPLLAALVAMGLYAALVHWQMPLLSVMVLVFLLMRIMLSLNKVQREYQKMASCDSAFWSLRAAIDEAGKESEGTLEGGPPHLHHAIYLKQVGFAYQNTWVLRKLSLTIPAGSFTTIVGPSGAGKTTVVDLITGLLQPQEGELWIDDLQLHQVDRGQWRRMIGYVPQETFLLHDTVRHNVTLGSPELTEADVEQALRSAGVWEAIARLPEGMRSLVGERGGRLSGGQRQRVALARALVHKPQLLILDEATSALDPASEAAICATLAALRGQLTIVAISHRAPLMEVADKVYRLQEGSAVLIKDRQVKFSMESERPPSRVAK